MSSCNKNILRRYLNKVSYCSGSTQFISRLLALEPVCTPSLCPWAGLRMRGSSAQQHSGAGSDKMPGSGPGTGTHSINDTDSRPEMLLDTDITHVMCRETQ